MTKGKKIGLFIAAAFLGSLAYAGIRFGKDARALWHSGIIDLSKEEKKAYQGSSEDNIKALQVALMLYHDSEGAFPPADRWMDAILNRLDSGELKKGEGEKKLHNPLLGGESYGYSLNKAFAEKYKEDVKDWQNLPLLFDSESKTRNASGDPATDTPKSERQGGNLTITTEGILFRNGERVTDSPKP